MIIEVFKTNVSDPVQASRLVLVLSAIFPGSKVNFDLQDCDHILRVEASSLCIDTIISTLHHNGFTCELLD